MATRSGQQAVTGANAMEKDLHRGIWLLLPVAVFIFPYLLQSSSENADLYLYGEGGWVEVSTLLFLFVAMIFGVALLKAKDFSHYSWFRWWLVLFVLGCVYFAGEEASWGQHFFDWETPQGWLGANDQGETNLHNTGFLFDQLPRALLSVAVLVGGVFMPLYRVITGKRFARRSVHYWLWPTHVCLPAALFSVLVSWHEKIYGIFNAKPSAVLDIRAGEVKESLLALFLMIYILSIWRRNRVLSPPGDDKP